MEEVYIPKWLFNANPYELPSLDIIVRQLIMISHRDVDIVYYSSLLNFYT